jgi:S-adenosylmethionine decarboxylase
MKAKMWNKVYWIKETTPQVLLSEYESLLLQSGFKILNYTEHHFKPYGFTCLFLLGESHLAIHTFPEHNKTYVELSSCVESVYNNFVGNHNG